MAIFHVPPGVSLPSNSLPPARRRNHHRHGGGRGGSALPDAHYNLPTYTPAVSSVPSDAEATPKLGEILYALTQILCLYGKQYYRSYSYRLGRVCRWIGILVGALIICVLINTFFVFRGFYHDATSLCVPKTMVDIASRESPFLVEYYIHGRGNGHNARSIAIIDRLNEAGVDVRMFIGRASLWKAFRESRKREDSASIHPHGSLSTSDADKPKPGVTTAISVTSITPSLSYPSAVSHILERIMGDCEVAAQTGRYPDLVITDGDLPGMIRAKLGGLPSVAISHGQTFAISQKPVWIANSRQLGKAWDAEAKLNARAGYWTDWQIATNFVEMEARVDTGVVARAPMRPEVHSMAVARLKRKAGSTKHDEQNKITKQDSAVANLVLYGSTTPEPNSPMIYPLEKNANRRKLVICYFRDKNGEVATNVLLGAGFDVLLFDKGYSTFGGKDNSSFGSKWIINRSKKKKHKTDTREREIDQKVEKTRGVLESTMPPAQLIRVKDMSLFAPLLSVADGVVSSAGSQLISECIYANVPLFALYKEDDYEQMLNVEMSRHIRQGGGVVYGTSFEQFRDAFRESSAGSGVIAVEDVVFRLTKRAKRSLAEFRKFADLVNEGTVSTKYLGDLLSSVQSDTRPNATSVLSKIDLPSKEITQLEQDRFYGMPDAAAVIMEIIKEESVKRSRTT
eukprot:scaffold30140_cov55-Attheya_sp.AAC.2